MIKNLIKMAGNFGGAKEDSGQPTPNKEDEEKMGAYSTIKIDFAF